MSTATVTTRKSARLFGVLVVVAGAILVAAGAVTWFVVQRELADQNIVVADDADFLAGDEVNGPFSAYAQAQVIGKHAEDIADGATYAELARDDPRRPQVMDASFLQASLYTSVVAFGVAAMAVGLGIVNVLIGLALMRLSPKTGEVASSGPPPPAYP